MTNKQKGMDIYMKILPKMLDKNIQEYVSLQVLRCMYPRVWPSLPLDLQMHRRKQPQKVQLLRRYTINNIGITPLYIVYFMIMLMVGLAMNSTNPASWSIFKCVRIIWVNSFGEGTTANLSPYKIKNKIESYTLTSMTFILISGPIPSKEKD